MLDAVGSTYYTYDAAGQLLSEDGPWANDTVNYTYTNRLRASLSLLAPNGDPWTQGYGYDAAKRLKTLSSPAGTFNYGYDATRHEEVNSLGLPNGAYITNTFDPVARLLSTTLENGTNGVLNAHSYGYDLAGERLWLTNVFLDYHHFTYDKIGQLVGASGYESNGTSRLQDQLGYLYDAAHNLNWRTNNGFWEDFAVNSLNELSTISRSTTNLTVGGTTTSPATNVTVNGSTANRYADRTFALGGFSLVNGDNTFTAIAQDALNRLATNSITVDLPSSASYTYDLNGNLLSDGTRNFAYDDENQLISVWVSNVWRSDFVYDGKMRRRWRFESSWNGSTWVTNTTVRYVYDGNLVIQERDANNLPLVGYTRGRDLSGTMQGAGGIGGMLARSDLTALYVQPATAHAYYHADGNGNITALISTNQAIAARYVYDPYGNTLSQAGPLADANLYRFSSKEWQVSSGLVYYLYRFYDPSTQRWLNSDPLGDSGSLVYNVEKIGPRIEARSAAERAMMVQQFKDPLRAFTQVNLNLALFVANNPIANVDPRGLDWLDCMASCIESKDPLNNLGKACLTGLGGTFPKSWWPAGGGIGGGGSPITTLPSRISLGAGGGNAARVVGRIFSPIWIGYGLYMAGVEAACAGTCTGDPTTTFPQTGPSGGFSGGGGGFGGGGAGGVW